MGGRAGERGLRVRRHAPLAPLSLYSSLPHLDFLSPAPSPPPYPPPQAKAEANRAAKDIGAARKRGEDTTAAQASVKALKDKVIDLGKSADEAGARRDSLLSRVGNLIPDACPVAQSEDDNVVVRTWGEPRDKVRAPYNHVDLVHMLGIVDLEAGAAVAGGRGYYLMDEGVLLNQAGRGVVRSSEIVSVRPSLIVHPSLFVHPFRSIPTIPSLRSAAPPRQAIIQLALSTLVKKGHRPVHTPFFMTKSMMARCAQLAQFDEELYHVTGEGEDKYLIATSEQTLCAMHAGKWFHESELPLKQAGYSTCFRKEVGSHGRDTLGIFRVHQFEKVEQFVVCCPEDSDDILQQLVRNAEEFYEALEVPYRVVHMVSGALNDAAAQKYDLEAWFPGGQAYRELVSASNCTDYQSRSLDLRLRTPDVKGQDKVKAHPHLLNATLCATERALCCLLETHQDADGVIVPAALRPFMGGIERIDFKRRKVGEGKFEDLPRGGELGENGGGD